jgi:hypothetical protein
MHLRTPRTFQRVFRPRSFYNRKDFGLGRKLGLGSL